MAILASLSRLQAYSVSVVALEHTLLTRRIAMLCLTCAVLALSATAYPDQVLVDFGKDFNLAAIEASDAKLGHAGATLRLETGHKGDRSGIVVKAPGGHWNLSAFQYVTVNVKNVGQNRVTVHCQVDNPSIDGSKNSVMQDIELPAKGQGMLRVAMPRRLP